MRRSYFKVYQYRVTLDGVSKRIECPRKLNYKVSIATYRAKGYSRISFEYLGSYIWAE